MHIYTGLALLGGESMLFLKCSSLAGGKSPSAAGLPARSAVFQTLVKYGGPAILGARTIVKYGDPAPWGTECVHIYAGLALWVTESMRIYAGLALWVTESMRIYAGLARW